MSFLEYILDFFKRLVRSRTDSVQIRGKSAMRNAEYRAKSAVSNKFNRAVDGATKKAKDSVTVKKEEKAEEPKDEAPTSG